MVSEENKHESSLKMGDLNDYILLCSSTRASTCKLRYLLQHFSLYIRMLNRDMIHTRPDRNLIHKENPRCRKMTLAYMPRHAQVSQTEKWKIQMVKVRIELKEFVTSWKGTHALPAGIEMAHALEL